MDATRRALLGAAALGASANGRTIRHFACAVGRNAPRPDRFRRMAPPLKGKCLIPHPPTEGRTP
jgi:hypothetical protein